MMQAAGTKHLAVMRVIRRVMLWVTCVFMHVSVLAQVV